jgi:uncharacterized protein YoaH (UPF0181 family)
MASDQQKALERYEELQALYIELGYHLQMVQAEIERGELETDRADNINDNLDSMRRRVQDIDYRTSK